MKNFNWILKEVYMIALLVCHCFNKGSCNIRWPDGNYALPMSVYGCPEPDMASWKYGYINISFTERTDLYEKTLGSIGWNHSFLMLLGPYGPYSYQLNFCTKDPASSTIAATDTPMWPPGKYSIFGTAAGCPEGFAEKNITVDIPKIEHINKDGALPAIDVRIEDGSSLISFLFCEKEVSAMVEPIHEAISFPFVVHMVQDESVLQTSDYFDVINEQLYFVSNNNRGHQHIHNWLNYSVILPKRYEHVLPKEDCYDNPFLYSGTVSITVTGFECKPWTDFIGISSAVQDDTFPDGSVSKAENFCRNPDHDEGGPWCYTTNPDFSWEYCRVPECEEQEKEDCWEKDYSNLYLGHIDVTASGRQCQPWASQEPHAHNMIKHFPSNQSMITAKNYCRDPDGEGKPWCYTMDPEVRAEFCNVPLCRSLMPGLGNADCWETGFSNLYSGKINVTESGLTCQAWSVQEPHPHNRGELFPSPQSLIDAKNYCRDPDGEGAPWCYTIDPNVRWEYCSVPYCPTHYSEICVDKTEDCPTLDPRSIFCSMKANICKKTCNACAVEIVNIDCFKNPFHYAGNISTTDTGYSCQPWTNFIGQKWYMVDYNFPEGSIVRAKNYCRSPDHIGDDPWCFTTNPDIAWEFCGVNKCKGQKSYVMDYNFPEGSIVSAENFCRSPDRGGFNPWCFSTNPVEMWEYCDVKECTDDPYNCFDESEECPQVSIARAEFCNTMGHQCKQTCGLCYNDAGSTSVRLPIPDEVILGGYMSILAKDEEIYPNTSIWLLYDLGESVTVSSIQIDLPYHLDNSAKNHIVPHILLSQTRWNYLNNGVIHCQRYISTQDETLDIKCLNSPLSAGRYLVLGFDKIAKSLLHTRQLLNGEWKLTFIHKAGSLSCGQTLGMGAGTVEDFQITSSSRYSDYSAVGGRPNGAGWCASPDDENPFFQVDLMQPQMVEGIQIFNWEETGHETSSSHYSPYIKGMGVYSFIIEYSHNRSEYDVYTYRQKLYLDRHIPYKEGQLFLFASPITATVVRIRPISKIDIAGMLCLRLELIGCPLVAMDKSGCQGDDREWYASRTIYVHSYEKYSPQKSVTNSSESCKWTCETSTDRCSAVVYNKDSYICSVYEESSTSNYDELQLDNTKEEGFVRVCNREEVIDNFQRRQRVSLYLSNETGWGNITTTVAHTDFILSQGYPFHYTPGMMWLWEIAFDDNTYVGLLFSNISFSVYQETSDILSNHDPHLFLTRTDSLFVLKSSFDLTNVFVVPETLNYLDDILDVLDKNKNNERAQYRTNERKLRLLLRTHQQDVPVVQAGSGFRALAFSSDMVTCLPWEKCSSEEAVLSSSNFLGSPELILYDTWQIVGDGYEYIVVNFQHFYIVCDSSSDFSINLGYKDIEYCNMGMQRIITSVYSFVQVNYQLARYPGFLQEGFYAKFNIISRDPRFMAEDNNTQNEIISFSGNVMEKYNERVLYGNLDICSAYYNKCYVLVQVPTTDFTWNFMFNQLCQSYGYSPLTIHSKSEQDFIGHYVQQHVQNRKNRRHDFMYIALYRQKHPNKDETITWKDGSPVTFTAWARDQPSTTRGHDCTRMNITSLTDDYTWDLIPCDQAMAKYGGCQYSNRGTNITRDIEREQRDEVSLGTEEWSVRSNLELSSFFICDNGIISFLGVCDGKQDCLDGSDEKNCIHLISSCSVAEYRCSNGHCISISLLCDHKNDCSDGKDEDCYFPSCNSTEFRCNNSQCVDLQSRCDTMEDCLDSSDEVGCVETECNDGASFLCDDTKCIPNSKLCDGMLDCENGQDELDCVIPKTCPEWWDAGYSTSGTYTVHGENMYCDFDQVTSNNRILTKYSGIDIRRNVITDVFFRYINLNVIEKLHQEGLCYQSMDQRCLPWFELLYGMETNDTRGHINLCQCVRYVHWFNRDDILYEDCEGGTISNLGEIFHLTFSFHKNQKYLLGGAKRETFHEEDFMLEINPIVCISDAVPENHNIGCGHGVTAPKKTRCLYNLDEFWNIIGCRNLAHLQDCASFPCPKGYVKCHKSFCLENRFVCDGIQQCEHGEDEKHCDKRTCPDQYRCLQSNICLNVSYLCDGYRQCPLGDDERLCNFRCPDGCSCFGYSMDCSKANDTINNTTRFSSVTRWVDASNNLHLVPHLYSQRHQFVYLAYLNLSNCQISSIQSNFFLSMKNLLTLDISNNKLDKINSNLFIGQTRLKSLILKGNLELLRIEPNAFTGLNRMNLFMLSHINIERMSRNSFFGLNLKFLDLSFNTIEFATDQVFQGLNVESLYLNQTYIKRFTKGLFRGLHNTSIIVTSAYKYCCIRPSNVAEDNCYPHQDEFSSCADLMRNDILRPLIWEIGSFALLGNVLSLIYRFIYDRSRLRLGYGIFVTNLAFADFLMGAYMITIASADVFYRGRYIFNDESWRSSLWCKLAGMISTISSEASVLFLCLITIDRVFVIKYPFGQIRFTPKYASFACAAVWFVSIVIAILPFAITSYFEDSFYSKSGVCLALPLTRDRSPGWLYSISIFIIFNSVAFLLIAFGQWSIYREISASTTFVNQIKASSIKRFFGKRKVTSAPSTSVRTGRNNDLRVSRNLLLIVSTDFMCWCPIGVLGILALTDHVIPGDVYAWTAVIVLPINSALNPFLYTFSAIFGKRKFAPDTSEQSRKEFVSTDEIQEHLNIWKSRWFFKASQQVHKMKPLQSLLVKGDMRLQQCLDITLGIAKHLHFIHQKNLMQQDLDTEDIYFRKDKSGRLYIFLDFRPMMVKKETQLSANIERLGFIVSTLLLHRKKRKRDTKL